MMSRQKTLRRVLVIAYYFPPLGLSGVQRTLKFVKYLPSLGWQPTVLTVEEGAYFAKDETLLAELDAMNVDVVRTPSLDPMRLFRRHSTVQMPSRSAHAALRGISNSILLPDNKIGWKNHALAAAMKLLQNDAFDLLFATAPPYTDFLIGAELRRRSGLPLVLDYRDAWIDNPLNQYPTPFHRLVHRRMERRVLHEADHVVTINRRIKELLLHSYPQLSHNNVSIIPQGYDQEDFQQSTEPRKSTKLRITYSGTFYFDRSPLHFLTALRMLRDAYPDVADDIEVLFMGTMRDEDHAIIERLQLGDMIECAGYLPHRTAVRRLTESDVLWLLIGNGRGSDMMSTGKLYEYLGARRSILATIPDGVARELLQKSGAAVFAEPDDSSGIMQAVRTLYELHKNHKLPVPPYDFVSQFDRRRLTGDLVKVFGTALHPDPAETRVQTRSTVRRPPDEFTDQQHPPIQES